MRLLWCWVFSSTLSRGWRILRMLHWARTLSRGCLDFRRVARLDLPGRAASGFAGMLPLDLLCWARENGRVIEVTEPQVWVLIGVFAASMFGMITIVTVSITRTLTAAIGGVRSEIAGLESGLRAEIVGLRETMDARFAAVDARFSNVDARFEAMDAKFSGKFELLDRDIQALSRRVFGAE